MTEIQEQEVDTVVVEAGYLASLEELLHSTDGVDYGGGAFIDMYGTKKDANGAAHKVKIGLISHAKTPEGALRNLMSAVKVAIEEYKMQPYDFTLQNSPAVNAPSTPAIAKQPAAGTMTPTAPGAPVPAAPKTPASSAGETVLRGGTFDIVKIEVLPKTDGKVEVKFWASGRKFADLTAVKTPEAMAKMFAEGTGAGWLPEHFSKVGAYETALKVYWVPSEKTNSNGVPYKNLSKIENA